jgi:hypothetical protein
LPAGSAIAARTAALPGNAGLLRVIFAIAVTFTAMELLHAPLLGTVATAGAIVLGPQEGSIGQLTYIRAT